MTSPLWHCQDCKQARRDFGPQARCEEHRGKGNNDEFA